MLPRGQKGCRVAVADLSEEAQKHYKLLQPKHKIFILSYLACWNLGKAALEAGYADSSLSF